MDTCSDTVWMSTLLGATAPRKIGRRSVLLVVAALLAIAGLGYLARFGECNVHSRYCVVAVANTRSEVGFTWDTWSFYVSTYPNETLSI